MKICAICKHDIKDGYPFHKYWIPELGEWCCNSCMKFSEEVNKEIDAQTLRLLMPLIGERHDER
jgi:hypothetical protein